MGFSWCHGGAILNASSLTWTTLKFHGESEGTDEVGYTLLPDNTVLGVLRHSEIYNVSTDTWKEAGDIQSVSN